MDVLLSSLSLQPINLQPAFSILLGYKIPDTGIGENSDAGPRFVFPFQVLAKGFPAFPAALKGSRTQQET
jgi:hypothetical protein